MPESINARYAALWRPAQNKWQGDQSQQPDDEEDFRIQESHKAQCQNPDGHAKAGARWDQTDYWNNLMG
ncbi:MAG: hypothetical protein EB015_20005 [Methylocystaceae bacterium]|nr:hypothetical protein [Methylocystaceae bacterium]